MDRQRSGRQFTSQFIQDCKDGFAGYELTCTGEDAMRTRVATVIYWDAMGQFFVETFGDVPLDILEELIQESKAAIRRK